MKTGNCIKTLTLYHNTRTMFCIAGHRLKKIENMAPATVHTAAYCFEAPLDILLRNNMNCVILIIRGVIPMYFNRIVMC